MDATHHYQHGEKVSFGLASMLMMEDRSIELIDTVYDFCLSVGLPIAFADIGLEGVGRNELRKVADAACAPGETIHNEPFPVHASMVVDATISADAYARERRRSYSGEDADPGGVACPAQCTESSRPIPSPLRTTWDHGTHHRSRLTPPPVRDRG